MTKVEYLAEMLSEVIPIGMPAEELKAIAKDIIEGLDNWYEMSGDSVASANRYGYLEAEIQRAKKEKEDEIQKVEQNHKRQLEDIDRQNKWVYSQYQQKIDELKKQVK